MMDMDAFKMSFGEAHLIPYRISTTNTRWPTRTIEQKNYKEIADVQIPRCRRALQKPAKDQLYPIEIMERDDEQGQAKVHYIGYGECYDE